MTNKDPPDWGTSYFKDRLDPEDGNFRLVELRLPHDRRSQPAYGPFEYVGVAARERLRRFCAAYLTGFGDLTEREAGRILRKSEAADARGRRS